MEYLLFFLWITIMCALLYKVFAASKALKKTLDSKK